MNTLIPLEYYTLVYYHFLAAVILGTYLQGIRLAIDSNENIKLKSTLGVVYVLVLTFLIGGRPVSAKYFGDMGTYANIYERYALGDPVLEGKDVYFEYFMKICSQIMTVEYFFLLCSILYVFPLYYATKNLFREYWFYAFVMLAVSLSFYAYGVNGVRNGIATSFVILACSIKDRRIQILLLIMGVMFHKSIMIPIIAYIITSFYGDTRRYLIFWLITIPLSIGLGSFWERFFLDFGFGEAERLQGYLSGEESEFSEQFADVGFRWDFVIYSFSGVFAGWYFIIKKKFEDATYTQLFNLYLLTNGFWILVIRATFSNRFAYLSWFILGIVIIYPMLKMQFWNKHHIVVVKIIAIYFLFTYTMNIILR